jgi:orotate phosphoribosyltransferase
MLGSVKTNDPQLSRLAELVQELSVVHEKVTLASGQESDFYVDMRRATLHHEAAPLIGHVMIDLLEENGFPLEKIDAVGGLTMGADPVATAMMHAAASRGLELDAFVVRKAAKDHGMKRQIEGPSVQGKKVVVLEDTSTTGGSPLQAAKALEAAGAEVLAVAVIVDRDTDAAKNIAQAGYPYFYALGLDDLGLR